jgi:hypothetical protein
MTETEVIVILIISSMICLAVLCAADHIIDEMNGKKR